MAYVDMLRNEIADPELADFGDSVSGEHRKGM